jgi:antitoxin PrlF
MLEGKVSSKYQLTLPVEIRKALGIRPGDVVRYDIQDGTLSVKVVRPDVGQVLEWLWAEHDMATLHSETGGDAVTHVREQRGRSDFDDDLDE